MIESTLIIQNIILAFLVGMCLWTMLTVRQIWEKISKGNLAEFKIQLGSDDDD